MQQSKDSTGGWAAAPLNMPAEEFRALGHDLVDRIADFLATTARRPAAPDLTPQAARRRVGQEPLPESGATAGELLDHAADLLFDGCRLNGHPRSWGYII
ncbi:MAG: hypothetical protein ACE5GS_14005, partial [Kiloniellaceae bacterium]